MIVSLFAAVVLMAQAAPAAEPAPVAETAAAAAPAAAPAALPVSDKKKLTKEGMICRNEMVIGSKLPKKVCTRASEDAERKNRDRELTEYIQHSTRVASGN